MKTKKLLSLLLAVAMVVSMMATFGLQAGAADTRSRVIQKPCGAYYCVNGKNKCLTCDGSGKRTCTDCGGTNICPSCGGDETILCWCEHGKCHVCDENGKIDCDLCDATGYKGNCTLCGGDGIIEVDGSLITFDTNGIQIKENLTQPNAVENGNNFTAFPIISAEGKIFLGWSTDKTAKTASYVKGNTYQVFADITFYAIWKNDNSCKLDLDESTADIKEKKELDQNYNLTVEEGTKTDATKVKLSWEITDINATRTDNKVWDTTELKWVTASSSTVIDDNGTAKFTLKNYSSVKINATASFETIGDFEGTASYDVADGKATVDTANGNSTYSKNNIPTKVINATITTDEDDFNTLAATGTATKYGTYTITIAKQIRKLQVVFSSVTTPDYGITINGKNITRTQDGIYLINAGDVVCISWDQDRTAVTVRKTLADFENTSVVSLNSPTTTSTSHTYTVPNDDYNYVLDFAPPMA